MIQYIVYKTINLITNEFYIGQHGTRQSEFDGYLGSGKLIKNSIKKYGKNNFERETLFSFDTRKEAQSQEKKIITDKIISDHLCLNDEHGGTGGNLFNKPFSDEHRNNISASLKGIKRSEKSIKRSAESRKGRIVSEETRKKLKESNTGKKHSEETKMKISEVQLGKKRGPYSKVKEIK